jgi:hypothetical protein
LIATLVIICQPSICIHYNLFKVPLEDYI